MAISFEISRYLLLGRTGCYGDFLQFSVSSNATSIVATLMSLYIDIFAFMSSIEGRSLEWLENCYFSKF